MLLSVLSDISNIYWGIVCIFPGYRLNTGQGQELVLDYVIERKRIDDMASSIIDGRFKEQKVSSCSCNIHSLTMLIELCRKILFEFLITLWKEKIALTFSYEMVV